MGNLFSYDSRFMQALIMVYDHILLNVLFLVCCVPVFTIGAAQAGLYSGLRVLHDQEDDSSCFRAFWKGVCNGFGKITAVWVGAALIMSASANCLMYLVTLEQVDYAPLFTCLVVLAICMVYQFALSLFHSRFGCTAAQLAKNVVYIILGHPVRCVAGAVLLWIPAAVFLCAPSLFIQMTMVWTVAYYSIAFGINLRIMEKPFRVLAEGFETKNKPI